MQIKTRRLCIVKLLISSARHYWQTFLLRTSYSQSWGIIITFLNYNPAPCNCHDGKRSDTDKMHVRSCLNLPKEQFKTVKNRLRVYFFWTNRQNKLHWSGYSQVENIHKKYFVCRMKREIIKC